MPFVEKSYEVLSGGRRQSYEDSRQSLEDNRQTFDETPDTSALAEQLMRHREKLEQQQQIQQVRSV